MSLPGQLHDSSESKDTQWSTLQFSKALVIAELTGRQVKRRPTKRAIPVVSSRGHEGFLPSTLVSRRPATANSMRIGIEGCIGLELALCGRPNSHALVVWTLDRSLQSSGLWSGTVTAGTTEEAIGS